MPKPALESEYHEPTDELFILVGRFFHYWAYVEVSVMRLIVRMIRTPDLHVLVLGPNMEFQKKLNILAAGADFSPHLAHLGKAEAVAQLVADCRSLYADRNKLAHYHWHMTKGGKLTIARVQAVETVTDAAIVWTTKQLEWKVKECTRVNGALAAISDAIKPVPLPRRSTNLLRLLSEIELGTQTDNTPTP